MKFYDLEWLAEKCGTDNKYEITAKVAAEARRESEESTFAKSEEDGHLENERFISNVLSEIENDTSPISINYHPAPVKRAEEEIIAEADPKKDSVQEEDMEEEENTEEEIDESMERQEEEEEEEEKEEGKTSKQRSKTTKKAAEKKTENKTQKTKKKIAEDNNSSSEENE